jgi:hypothetical protein
VPASNAMPSELEYNNLVYGTACYTPMVKSILCRRNRRPGARARRRLDCYCSNEQSSRFKHEDDLAVRSFGTTNCGLSGEKLQS